MAEVYFHCSDASHELIDGSGTTVNDLSEAFAHADGLMRAMLMNPKHGRLARLGAARHRRVRRRDLHRPLRFRPRQAALSIRMSFAHAPCADVASSGIAIAVRRAV